MSFTVTISTNLDLPAWEFIAVIVDVDWGVTVTGPENQPLELSRVTPFGSDGATSK
jgi:hypothetical protein